MATVGLRNHLFHRPEECDSFQPCFFEHETDVEFYGTRAPMPSDEIWDKFELLPTPPRSPNREPIAERYSCSLLDTEAERLHLQPLLGVEQDVSPVLVKTLPFPESPPTSGVGLNSKLIQDCMWSGRNLLIGDICVEKVKLEKLQTTCNHGSVAKKNTLNSVGQVCVDVNLPTDCVDPAAVFPYPINGTREYLGTDTPSDSEDEEGDEEIDVVNVEKMQSAQVPTRQTVGAPVSQVSHHPTKMFSADHQLLSVAQRTTARLLLPAVHACHTYSKQIPPATEHSRSGTTSPVQGHSTNLKRTCKSSSLPSSPQPAQHTPAKRSRRQLTVPELKKVCQKLKGCSSSRNSSYSSCSPSSSCSSRFGSDSEDGECGGKRTQHNVLERKRRNDLKYSFFSLRDSVPDLNKQERAPKVVILRKATDYILDLAARHNRIIKELEKQKTRNEQLKKALHSLS